MMIRSILGVLAALLLVACGGASDPPAASSDGEPNYRLVALGERALGVDEDVTIRLGADNRLSGNAGCNNFSAAYRLNEQSLYITALALTRMQCQEPEGVMALEQDIVAALEAALSLRTSATGATIDTEHPAAQLTLERIAE